MDKEKYCFVSDNDGHKYMIPSDLREVFYDLLDKWHDLFDSVFEVYVINNYKDYEFENPTLRKE